MSYILEAFPIVAMMVLCPLFVFLGPDSVSSVLDSVSSVFDSVSSVFDSVLKRIVMCILRPGGISQRW